MRRSLIAFPLTLILCSASFAAPRTNREHTSLSKLVASDPEAAQLFAGIKDRADAALHDRPNPIKTIISEGRLNSDPERIRTYKSLPDIDKMDALHWAWVVTSDEKYRDKLHDFLLAWAKVNASIGDPIDDTKLEPAFLAYADVRDSFSDEDRKTTDAWLKQTADALIAFYGKRPEVMKNNWESHRLKILGIVGFILHDHDLISYTTTHYKQQIQDNLLPSGSSIDFDDRDALHYHIYDIEPLLTLCIEADQHGIDLYPYTSPSGASLPKAVAFLVPFADGSKPHAEFVHSKVDFDRRRAASGDPAYKAGLTFNPHTARNALELASYFDSSLAPLACKLGEPPAKHFPDWTLVVITAERTDK